MLTTKHKNMDDKATLKQLIREGYKIAVKNPDGKTFQDRYTVYQSFGWNQLKVAVVSPSGQVVGAQG